MVEFGLFEARTGRGQQSHEPEHRVHVILAGHLGLERGHNLLDIGLLLHYVVFHAETLHIVDALLSFFDFHGDIDVRVDKLFALSDVHLLDISHVVCHLFD